MEGKEGEEGGREGGRQGERGKELFDIAGR